MEAYSKMVEALAKDGAQIANELDGRDAHLLHMVVGISGEAGELLAANFDKLSVRYGKGSYSDQQAQERADKNNNS